MSNNDLNNKKKNKKKKKPSQSENKHGSSKAATDLNTIPKKSSILDVDNTTAKPLNEDTSFISADDSLSKNTHEPKFSGVNSHEELQQDYLVESDHQIKITSKTCSSTSSMNCNSGNNKDQFLKNQQEPMKNKESCCSSSASGNNKDQLLKNQQETKKPKDSCCSSDRVGCQKKKMNQHSTKELCIQIADPQPSHLSEHEEMLYVNISGMTCGGCSTRVESFLGQKIGIVEVNVNLLTSKAEIVYIPSEIQPVDIVSSINGIGFKASILTNNSSENNAITFRIPQKNYTQVCSYLQQRKGVLKLTQGEIPDDFPLERHIIVVYDPLLEGPRHLFNGISKDLNIDLHLAAETNEINKKSYQDMQKLKDLFILSVILTIPVILIHYIVEPFAIVNSLNSTALSGVSFGDFICACLAIIVQFYVAFPIYSSAYYSLRYSHRVDMDVLIAMSTSFALAFSLFNIAVSALTGDNKKPETFFEVSTVLIMLVLFSRYIEKYSKTQTYQSIQSLLEFQVKTAILVENGNESYIGINLVQKNDILKVLPGAKIPTDGIVIEGNSTVNESIITGESHAVPKKVDSQVIGGTINLHGVLFMKVTHTTNESLLHQIVEMVEDAQNSRPQAQRIADVVASNFTSFIIATAVSMFIMWYILASSNYVSTQGLTPFAFALRFAITILVASCPCSVSLAVPTAIMVATGVGARMGILFKGGDILESFHSIDTVVFDKTGTLTTGTLSVASSLIFTKDNLKIKDEINFWVYAGSAEVHSEHSIGKAIVAHAKSLDCELLPLSGYTIQPGCGVSGEVDGKSVVVGSFSWLQSQGITFPAEHSSSFDAFQMKGYIVVCVAVEGTLRGLVALMDTPRPEAKAVIEVLHRRGLNVWMLTGDQVGTAKTVAAAVGIMPTCVVAGVLPQTKAEKIGVFQSMGKTVAFVGDGVNDAPGLAKANVGIAIGAGTDVAISAADIVLVKSELASLLVALELSAVTARRIKFNFAWGFLYNLLMMPLASGALYVTFHLYIPPELAGVSELVSSVPVVLSSLLLKCWKPHDITKLPNQNTTEVVTHRKSCPVSPELAARMTKSSERSPLLG